MLHKNIQHLITERKAMKKDIAEYLNVSRSTLTKYLSGEWPIPSDKIELIAKFFNVSPGSLFSKEENKDVWAAIKQQQKQIEKLTKNMNDIANSLQMKSK